MNKNRKIAKKLSLTEKQANILEKKAEQAGKTQADFMGAILEAMETIAPDKFIEDFGKHANDVTEDDLIAISANDVKNEYPYGLTKEENDRFLLAILNHRNIYDMPLMLGHAPTEDEIQTLEDKWHEDLPEYSDVIKERFQQTRDMAEKYRTGEWSGYFPYKGADKAKYPVYQ